MKLIISKFDFIIRYLQYSCSLNEGGYLFSSTTTDVAAVSMASCKIFEHGKVRNSEKKTRDRF